MTSIRNSGNKRVAILVDTSTSWGRAVAMGVHQQAQIENWQLFLEPKGVGELFELPESWNGDGVIARINDETLVDHLARRRLPVVNVSSIEISSMPFPRVCTDLVAAGHMAADYFLRRGFRHFAYLGLLGLRYTDRHRSAFADVLKQAGHECEVFTVHASGKTQALDWNMKIDELATWLKRLPKPVAILTWTGGSEVIHGCHHAGLVVPEEVAVLSGSDDDLLCQLADIPVSAVRQAAERIGREAAVQLGAMMAAPQLPMPPDKLIAPEEVVTRQSTDTFAVKDPRLWSALSFIRENLDKPFTVDEVAAGAGFSRRMLERRFDKILRRSPAEYIRRARLDRAKRLLAKTDLTVAEVAESAGFGSPEYLAQLFRTQTGESPLKYRQARQSEKR